MAVMVYSSDSPAGKILTHLQRYGEGSVKDLEKVLAISTTAVREHLTHLQAKELIATKVVRRGTGRPHLVYFLTPKAQRLFPKQYDTLINMLLEEIASRDGGEHLQMLLDAVARRLAAEYDGEVRGEELAEQLASLRGALEQRGIPIEPHHSGNGFQMLACPFFDVAQRHPGICAMERRMFEQVLDRPVALEGTIREGRPNCRFIITSKQ